MSSLSVDDIKEAITQLPDGERASLAHWMNVSMVRSALTAADDEIARGEGTAYNEETLPNLFAETRAAAMRLLKEKR